MLVVSKIQYKGYNMPVFSVRKEVFNLYVALTVLDTDTGSSYVETRIENLPQVYGVIFCGEDLILRTITKQDIKALSLMSNLWCVSTDSFRFDTDKCTPVRNIETKYGVQGSGYLLDSGSLVVVDWNSYKLYNTGDAAMIYRENVYRIDTLFSFVCSVCRVFPELLSGSNMTITTYKDHNTLSLSLDVSEKLKLLILKQNCLVC